MHTVRAVFRRSRSPSSLSAADDLTATESVLGHLAKQQEEYGEMLKVVSNSKLLRFKLRRRV